MKLFLALLLATLCAATGYGQTMKALSYNTTNGVVAYSSTNVLTFTNEQLDLRTIGADGTQVWDVVNNLFFTDLSLQNSSISFNGTNAAFAAATTRTNLNLGATWLTNTNVTNFCTAIGLGETSEPQFQAILLTEGTNTFTLSSLAGVNRTNLGLGATNIVTFAGLTNNGDITINSTTASNGLLYIRRTNNEPFLGLANLLASNNTTISNETLFRVGTAEATNRSAQFGFRSTNTNGSGVAVFSVFGFNALMMVGADASTNAVIYSGGGTNNEVMTLIRDGATEFARPIRFSTNASTRPATNAPANTTNVAAWIEFRIGTNSYRAALYQ
jgi:hypothetical protein